MQAICNAGQGYTALAAAVHSAKYRAFNVYIDSPLWNADSRKWNLKRIVAFAVGRPWTMPKTL